MANEKKPVPTEDGEVRLNQLSGATDEQLGKLKSRYLKQYFYASSMLRKRYKRNDLFYQLRHWELLTNPDEATSAGLTPVTPVLFATIDSIHADIMDAYPEATILGETVEDAPQGEIITDTVEFVYNRRRYRRTWRDWALSLLIHGTAIHEVFWDKTLYNGLGDINVQYWSARNFLWNPIVANIQGSEMVFKVTFKPAELVEARYPGKKIERDSFTADSMHEEYYNRSPGNEHDGKPVMITDMWWREFDDDGKASVYMAKFAGGTLLERRTNESVYGHGMYPFVATACFPIEGQVHGMGFPDVFGDMQSTIDRLDQIMISNAELSSKVKLLVSAQAEVNEEELRDWNSPLVHGTRVSDDVLRWFQPKPLSPYTMQLQRNKIDDIKEESGQNAFVRGEGGKSVTAASAIMALQEAGSKRSRNIVTNLYDAFADVTDMVIKLIGEFYTEGRTFVITGKDGTMDNRTVSAADTMRNGETPIEFDIQVHVQKQVPYKSVYMDERLVQLVQLQAIPGKVAVQLMDFDRKDEVIAAMDAYDQEKALIQMLFEQVVELRQRLGLPIPEMPGGGGQAPQQPQPVQPTTQPSRMETGQSGMVLE